MNHHHWTHPENGMHIAASVFNAAQTQEVHLCLVPDAPSRFDIERTDLERAYAWALNELGLSENTAVFRRLFVSDAANQGARLCESRLCRATEASGPVSVSLVEQSPLPEHKLALWAYHVKGPEPLTKRAVGEGGVLLERGTARHLWLGGLRPIGKETGADSAAQTRNVFRQALSALGHLDATLEKDVLRTWLFVRDVDRNYAGLVRERRDLFTEHAMIADTHYITSTGIEGRSIDPACLVSMDFYAQPGILREQIRFLNAPEHLGPTALYGVTFERGTQVRHADRSHVFIAGTASIEPGGATVHVGDIDLQVARTLANIRALLADGGAGFEDVAQMIVYLRDPADRISVERALAEHLPPFPRVMVHAPVCRPDWLVEIECLAITPNNNPHLPLF